VVARDSSGGGDGFFILFLVLARPCVLLIAAKTLAREDLAAQFSGLRRFGSTIGPRLVTGA